MRCLRGLWRFDGDEEPVRVSRRTFLFLGGIAAAGALVPAVDPVAAFLERHPNPLPRLLDSDVVASYIEKLRARGTLQGAVKAEFHRGPLFLGGVPILEVTDCPRIELRRRAW